MGLALPGFFLLAKVG
ncbi:hypothetical protein LBUL_1637 [Lactobacillus delbrueckii subsp. bulgaricus ATCC BAA-365]|nr:hypothetical protein LBUL_1637 [Lactobacillus delbrueckii subsp. bulgaricus ATCC BAA-365]